MPTLRPAAAAVFLACCTFACAPKKSSRSEPPEAKGEAAARPAEDGAPLAVEHPVEWTDVDLRVEDLDALLATWAKMSVWWDKPPATPPDGRAEFESILLSLGAGPSLASSLDYAGVHEAVVSFPQPEQQDVADEKYRLAARIAVTDAGGFLGGLPPSLAPRSLGGGLWELSLDSERFLVREQAAAVEIGASERDLERARALPHPADPPYRIVASVSNLAEADVDPAPLFGLHEGDPRAERVAEVIRGIERIGFAVDLGPDQDLRAQLSVDAPVEKLGLEPLGGPLDAPGAVEQALPFAPIFAVEAAVKDAKAAYDMVAANVPVAEIPDPFGALAKRALDHFGTLAGLATERSLLALFVDDRGDVTVLLSARVRDPAAARDAARELLALLDEAAAAQNDLVGNDAKAKIRSKLRKNGWTAGSAKADVLTVTMPKDADVEATMLASFFDKGRIHLATWVHEDRLMLAVGAGARKLASGLGRRLGRGKPTGPWRPLELARADGGCQVCVGIDVDGFVGLLLRLSSDETDDAARRKALLADARALTRRRDHLHAGAGLRLAPGKGIVRSRVAKDALFPARDHVEALLAALERLDQVPPPAEGTGGGAPPPAKP